MMKSLIFLFVVLVLSTIGCKSPITVTKKEQSDAVTGVVRYALPQNKVLVKVVVTRDSLTPGIYSDTNKYMVVLKNLYYRMGLDSAYIKEKKPSVAYKLESITLADTSFVDNDAIYEVEFNKKWNRKASVTASTSNRSLIKGVKQEDTDKTLQIVSEVLGATSAAVLAALDEGALMPSLLEKDRLISLSDLSSKFATRGKPFSHDTIRATLSAIRLYELNNDILNLSSIAGAKEMREGALYDSGLKAIKEKKDELAQLFLYKKTTKTFNLVFAIDFDKSKMSCTNSGDIFSFDPKKGIEIKSSGFMPSDTVGLNKGALSAKKEDYSYSYKETDEQIVKSSTVFKPSDLDEVKGGFTYRIPLSIDLEIKKKGKHYLGKTSLISQLGTLVTIPVKLNSSDITYVENTGLISSISFGSESANKDDIKTAGENAVKAAGLYKSDLERKKAEIEKLKTDKELKELKEQLGGGE